MRSKLFLIPWRVENHFLGHSKHPHTIDRRIPAQTATHPSLISILVIYYLTNQAVPDTAVPSIPVLVAPISRYLSIPAGVHFGIKFVCAPPHPALLLYPWIPASLTSTESLHCHLAIHFYTHTSFDSLILPSSCPIPGLTPTHPSKYDLPAFQPYHRA